ncbi:MAG: DNA repair protein RecN [Bacteroidales bacterium]|nr:DNA repair protein RecN [Bacteroidales bacterium]
MLHKLTISNYALIDNLEISFTDGMTTITGETGAGKSIILGALSLLLGKRADTTVLKDKEKKSIVEATFSLPNDSLATFFESLDIDFDKETIIRREITPQGKSRSFVNDTPVGLQTLKELGTILIDIHSQHQNLFLKESSFQCQVVDAEANNVTLLEQYRQELQSLHSIEKELHTFLADIQKKKDDLSYYKFRLDELTKANIHEGELADLEQESTLMEHSEEIKTMLAQADEAFSGENALLGQLKNIQHSFERNARLSAQFQQIAERLSQSYIELSDISDEIAKNNANLDFDPQQKEEIENRLDLLNNLLHKYSASDEQSLLQKRDELQTLVDNLENADFHCDELQKQFDKQREIVSALAQKLHTNREKAIKNLCPQIVNLLQKLGMPSVSFNIMMTQAKEFHANGIDDIQMVFSANKNIAPQWLGEISSGGELSRVMLCLKYILAKNKSVQTIIFDEIDTGVSGEIADQMGTMMLDMAKEMQIITITHLPQIAVKAQKQFKVFKTETNETTSTNIVQLSHEQRIEEIAKMLSGKTISEAALNNAKMLLEAE